MKITKNENDQKRIAIITHLHGNEHFGKRLFEHFSRSINKYLGVLIVIANEEAMERDKRYIDQDLNRSFPGKKDGNHEEKLAKEILDLVKDYRYVIDIHTTTSEVKVVPIIAKLDEDTKALVNLTGSEEVIIMEKNKSSLIGNLKSAISLELNEAYAAECGIEVIEEYIDRLLNDTTKKPIGRKLFTTKGTIPLAFELPTKAKNFEYLEGLGYPYLLFEKNYTEYQGFFAESIQTEII